MIIIEIHVNDKSLLDIKSECIPLHHDLNPQSHTRRRHTIKTFSVLLVLYVTNLFLFWWFLCCYRKMLLTKIICRWFEVPWDWYDVTVMIGGFLLTHWGRVTHICVGKPTIIGSDNGLSPDRRQAIIWTNGGILLIGPLVTYFSEILAGIQTFLWENALENVVCEMSSISSRSQCVKFVANTI